MFNIAKTVELNKLNVNCNTKDITDGNYYHIYHIYHI